MRARMGTMLLLVAIPALAAGCATRNWVRDLVGKQGAETDRRFVAVEERLGAEAQRVEGVGTRVSKLEGTVDEVSGTARGAREQADAALSRAENAHGRAEAAFARADEVDQRLTKLWSRRHARNRVDSVEVTFGFDRADLDDGAQTALIGVVRELQANPALTVDLTGFTDPKGKRDYNIQLSYRRVEAVRRFLVEKGIDLPRINAVGLGPIMDSGLPDAKKRRVVVNLMVPAE